MTVITRRNDTWGLSFARGKTLLAKHRLEEALRRFEVALASCPVNRTKELSQIMFYIGITLNKLGMASCALKSLLSAHRLNRRGYAGIYLKRFANGYGMAKQASQDLDDWKAFYAVQLARYLNLKKTRKLGTDAEKDVIWELIMDGWQGLRNTVSLTERSVGQKLELFRSCEIVFPSFSVPEHSVEQPIQIDFARQKRVDLDDLCACGSGLPFKLCCGRIPGQDELETGII